MHEHIGEQLRRIEICGFEIVETGIGLKVRSEVARKYEHGQPDDQIDDDQILCYRRHL